jgi:hypothetical protein
MKESREQGDQLSPKKKKKKPLITTKRPTNNDKLEKKELKVAQEQVLLKGTQEILDY